jgi:hypothetical protein
MFERLKVFKEAGAKLYPYFTPSYNNCTRFIGFITSVIIVPVANYFMPMIFLKKDNDLENDSKNNIDVVTMLASASAIALLYGLQKGLSSLLIASTTQAMRKDNVQLLMDDSKFLIHGNNRDITSLQYVTVGVGVRDFTMNSVPVFISLPMDIMSSTSTLIHIGIITRSFTAPGVVFGFAVISAGAMTLFCKGYTAYLANNQEIENDLVAKIAFIEANRSAISLMGISNKECISVIQSLQKVDNSIPKITILAFFYYFLTTVSPAIASQFLGGYYTNHSIKDYSGDNIDFLNVMIMSSFDEYSRHSLDSN